MMSTKLKHKRNHIVVDDRNFKLIKSYGHICETMNDAVSEVLRVAQGHSKKS
jgi:hypothetical protein